MKIAFVGKGGSGKTTLSALVARFLASKGLPVIAIDSDINQHLAYSLGMNEADAAEVPHLGIEIKKIKEYLRGTNPLIVDADAMIKTTPPGTGSRLLRVREENPIYSHFVRDARGVKFMAVGAFSEEDTGVKCYHSKTGAVELILNHLIDGEKEYVLVDMTAGADAFASGIFTRFDVMFLVAEPTIKSISVYDQYKHYAEQYGVVIKVIGNKVETEEDKEFLSQRIGTDLVALVGHSRFVKESDRGHVLPLEELEPENVRTLEAIIACVDSQKKDWKKFYAQAVEFHIKNARSWANAAAGKDLTTQIDPKFDPRAFI